MDNKLYSLLNWSIGNKMSPIQLQIHLTNKCNLACGFCPTRATYKTLSKKELSKEKWKSIINEAISLGIKEFHLCGGGEPFFYKETALELMEMIKNKQCHGEIITNGTLLEEKDIKKLVEIEWDKIIFSLNSSKEDIDNYLRSEGAYEKTVENIKKFFKYKEKLKKNKPVLAIHVVLCNKNYKDISDLIKLASDIGCKEVLFNPMNIWSKWAEKLKLNKEHYKIIKKEIKDAEKLAKNLNIETNLDGIEDLESMTGEKKIKTICKNKLTKSENSFLNVPCFAPWFNLSIFPHGDVRPCFIITGDEFSENISEKKLKNIWEGEVFDRIREDFMKNNINWNCKNCNVYNIVDNKKLKEDILNLSDIKVLWKKIKDFENIVESNKHELTKKEKQIRNIVESNKHELTKKEKQIRNIKNELSLKKTELNKTRNKTEETKKELKKKNKDISFLKKEIYEFYNSRGYKFVLKPLANIYSSLKKRKRFKNKK